MKKIWSLLKPYLRWVILGGTLFFLVKAFKEHWEEVAVIQINAAGWTMLFVAFSITLVAHIWAGLVWSWILRIVQATDSVPLGSPGLPENQRG